ncbi:ATP-binding cassette domain-containing protein [Parabacteroides sp. ASD2025]|uniref:ATP-binding cassette domain-containing protein n=1 Tax=Parabacteroides sp. ASD2025 TaxID=3415987 RepID=UPI0026325262|nr:ATP-binding cassette domain-containing protein [uncultured Parabacteroides sp.]
MCTCLEVDSVVKAFKEKTVLSDVYLCCRPGDIIALFGHNGSGKSTLLNIIFGTLKGDRSFIRINGKVIKGAAYRTGMVAYLPQHDFIPPNLTIAQAVELYIPKEQYKQFLGDRFLFKVRNNKIAHLSGGELRYLEIKLILYSKAAYLLLDEPFNGLSPVAAEEIRMHIAESARTRGIILTDHNFREVHKIVNRILLLDQCYLKEIKEKEELIPYGYYQPG